MGLNGAVSDECGCRPMGSMAIFVRGSARLLGAAVLHLVEFLSGGASVDSGSVDTPRRRLFGMVFWRRSQAARFGEAARRAEAWSALGGGWFRLSGGHLVARNGWVSPPAKVGAQRSLGPFIVTCVGMDSECVTLVQRRVTAAAARTAEQGTVGL